jgi:hypothetical protein
MGKRLGRWLTERVNGGGAAAGIRARETTLQGRDGRAAMGFAVGCSEWGWRRGKGVEARRRRLAPFWEGAGEVGVRWGSGNRADTWRKRGTSRGGGRERERGAGR